MNLFLLAWNLPNEKVPLVLSEIDRMKDVYELLDPNTMWSFGRGTNVFAASMHTNNAAAAPRIYVKRNEDRVVLYAGSLVDRTGKFHAHDAAALASHWDDLPNALEGHFVAARVTKNPPSLEIVNDALGMCQVYYLRQNDTWLISNSSLLLGRIARMSELDPLGVSFFLCWGAGGSDRTLRRGIKVIPGGQQWKWEKGLSQPKRTTYFDRPQLSRQPQKTLAKADLERLAKALLDTCQSLADNFGTLNCPITAGRDSRLMVALTIAGGIKAEYFTNGLVESPDVRTGIKIAKHFNLPHKVEIEDEQLDDETSIDWEQATRRLILQNDGMLSFRSINHAFKQPRSIENLEITLYGAGGEIARGFYNSPQFVLGSRSLNYVHNYLSERLIDNHHPLLHRETIITLQQYVEEFVRQVVDEGFALIDVPDVFHTYEQVRRWVGIHIASNQSTHQDRFSPFCTRPFVETAYSIPALNRYSEQVHYQLIKFLVPDLHSFPLRKKWPPQQPILNLFDSFWNRNLKKTILKSYKQIRSGKSNYINLDANHQLKKFYRLESRRSQLREFCLDRPNSPVWNYIDRSKFEQITSRDTNSSERQKHIKLLWHIFTLFQYADTIG